MKLQLEQLFQFSHDSNTTRDDLQMEAIQPVDESGLSSRSVSTEPDDKTTNDLDVELPALAPLEVPKFDFGMLSDLKFDED